jgi:hypothetical protein
VLSCPGLPGSGKPNPRARGFPDGVCSQFLDNMVTLAVEIVWRHDDATGMLPQGLK